MFFAIFQKEQLKVYNYRMEKGDIVKLSDADLKEQSDLNSRFVDNARKVDVKARKIGTYTYRYEMMDAGYWFGFLIEYDAFHKQIKVANGGILTFQKN